LEVVNHQVSIRVIDNGSAYFDGNSFTPPTPGVCAGKMGIKTIRSVMDEVSWAYNEGTTVAMVKKLSNFDKSNLYLNKNYLVEALP
jgi:anti-sigma regulatory factor (Ser/Thr protein kinase)